MDPARAREVAEEICHPYFSHEIADALREYRELMEGVGPERMRYLWESERTDLGRVTVESWFVKHSRDNFQIGVMWRNYDGDGDLTSERFIWAHNVQAVEAALRELAG